MDLKRFLKKKLFPEILSYYRIKIIILSMRLCLTK